MKFLYEKNSGVSEAIIDEGRKKLNDYVLRCAEGAEKRDYEMNEASLCLPDDANILKKVQELVKKKKTDKLHYIIDVGIGGSNLGTKAIYDALWGTVDVLIPKRFPKIIFLDTNDPEFLTSFTQFFRTTIQSADEIIVNIISKSGGTTETAVNGEIILQLLQQKFENWKERCVITTDKNSPLWIRAQEQEIDTLEIPKKVGGRYSVFSPVGLFPLALCGVHIKNLLQGARKTRSVCLGNTKDNIALTAAAIFNEQLAKGIIINDNFYFHSELESLGKWFRQLMGESIGKEGKGLTPTVSMGSVDLHSMAQLYLGGPKNKITSFIYTNEFKRYDLPVKNILSHIHEIQGVTVGTIMGAIQQGTIAAYKKMSLPYTEVIFDSISEAELGGYMQFKMMEIMYLGHLMGVNAFDQPEVELYKRETKRILSGR